MSVQIIKVLQHLVPGCACCVWENDIDRIVWNDARPQPSKTEIEAAIPAVEAAQAMTEVAAYLQSLDDSMHAYINSRYSPSWQSYLQMVYADPESSAIKKAAAKAAGNWVKSIVEGYYKNLVLRVLAGETLTPKDTDWSAHFDATDPGVTLVNLS